MAEDGAGLCDMISLEVLSEESMLSNLRVRYDKDLIYTYTGSILVSVNPFKELPVYTQEILSGYIGQRLGAKPPHIFAVADNSYRSMVDESKNQSVLICGESGSGKTECTKLILQYLAAMTNQHNEIEELILESSPVLESFGNAKTSRNNNSSRFGKLIEISFNTSGYINGAKITRYLLEKSRVVTQAEGERNYHVFYQLLSGTNEEEKARLQLDDALFFRYLNQSGCTEITGVNDADHFDRTRLALQILGMDAKVQEDIFQIVAAVLHLGNIVFDAKDNGSTLSGPIGPISSLLQVNEKDLTKALVTKKITVKGQTTIIPLTPDQARDSRDGLSKELYSKLFEWLVNKINEVIVKPECKNSIGVLDIFGFENFKVNSFEQLCINYANEKLQLHFNQHIFKLEQEEYDKEKINWSKLTFPDNQACIDLIEKVSPLGILCILDEECRFPKASDSTFLEKINTNHGKHSCIEKPKKATNTFVVKHFAGSVAYQVDNFLEKNRGTIKADLFPILEKSSIALVSSLFHHVEEDDGNITASARKKVETVGGSFKTSLTQLMTFLSSTTASFIRCIKPNSTLSANKFDPDMVLSQLKYSGMFETVRIRRLGYPIRFPFAFYASRYSMIAPKHHKNDDKETCRVLMSSLDFSNEDWQLGITKIFLRETTRAKMEDLRNEAITKNVISIQSYFRMFFLRQYILSYKEVVIRAQAIVRRFLYRRRFLKTKSVAVAFQSASRMIHHRREYRLAVTKHRQHKTPAPLPSELPPSPRPEIHVESMLPPTISLPNIGPDNMDGVIPTRKRSYNISTLVGFHNLEKAMKQEALEEATEEKKWRAPRLIVRIEEPPELIGESEASKIKFEEYALQHFQKPKPKSILKSLTGKGLLMSELVCYQKKSLEASLLPLNAEDSKVAVLVFQRIIYHQQGCQGKTDWITNMRFILKQGLFRPDLRDEIYSQLLKQTAVAPNEERLRGWEIIAMCTSTFTCSYELLGYLVAACIQNQGSGPVGTLASFSLRRLRRAEQFLIENDRPFRTYRVKIPSIKEIESIKTASNIQFPVFLLDDRVITLEIDQATTAFEALGMLSSKIHLQDPIGFAIFEIYESNEGERFERSLDNEIIVDVMANAEYVKGSAIRFIFKRKLFLFPDEVLSADGVENKLTYEQVRLEVLKGNLAIPEETAHRLSALSLQVLLERKRPSEIKERDLIPKQFIEKSSKGWMSAAVAEYEQNKNKMNVEQCMEEYLRLASKASLWGCKLFHVVSKETNEFHLRNFELGVSIEGLHLIHSDTKAIIRSWYFDQIANMEAHESTLQIVALDRFNIALMTKEGTEIMSMFSDYQAFLMSESTDVKAVDDFASKDPALLSYRKGDIIKIVERNETEWFVGELKGKVGSFKTENVVVLLPRPKNKRLRAQTKAHVQAHDSNRDRSASAIRRGTRRGTRSDAGGETASKRRPTMLVSGPRRDTSAAAIRLEESDSVVEDTPHNGYEINDYFQHNVKGKGHERTVFSKEPISEPLTDVGESSSKIALRTFVKVMQFMEDYPKKRETEDEIAFSLIKDGLDYVAIRDEIFCQVIKQTRENGNPKSNQLGWLLLCLLVGIFVPGQQLYGFVLSYGQQNLKNKDEKVAHYAKMTVYRLVKNTQTRVRREPPSRAEIDGLKKRQLLAVDVFLPNGESVAVEADSFSTGGEFLDYVSFYFRMTVVDGWYITEIDSKTNERTIDRDDSICDALSKWQQKNSNFKFVLMKRLFLPSYREDEVSRLYLFHQVLWMIMTRKVPVSGTEAAFFAAMKLHSEYGEFSSREAVESVIYQKTLLPYFPKQYVHAVVHSVTAPPTLYDRMIVDYQSLKGLSKDACRSLLIQRMADWRISRSTPFVVEYQGSRGKKAMVIAAIDHTGIQLIDLESKTQKKSWALSNVQNWHPATNSFTITIGNLVAPSKEVFLTEQGYEMAFILQHYVDALKNPSASSAGGQKRQTNRYF